ncbi:MAG TPA: hypothetical protein VG754_13180 [Verrucomicrobiae bacterium]|nr:hypothetical protein [Verrucomicrobiae bacterium]
MIALFFAIEAGRVHAQNQNYSSRIDYDVLKREQRGLVNVLTDGETDLSSGETRLRNNSLRLSAEEVARAASKVAHLRAMAQLHPERCARTTGAFLLPAGAALQSLTNNFFGNIKPRIVRLEDNLDAYVTQLERLDPKLAAELRSLIDAYNRAAFDIVNNAANGSGSIEYNPSSIDAAVAPNLRGNKIFENINRSGGGGTSGGGAGDPNDPNNPNSPNYRGNGANDPNNPNYRGGNGANGGNGVINPGSFHGTIRDTGGQILNADDFLDNKTVVKRTKSDNGILTREEKTSGDIVPDGNGGAVFRKRDSKAIDWQFDIEANENGFALVDRSNGPADEDKGFSVQSWTVKDPSGQTQDFPGTEQLKYAMSAPGKYTITAKVLTKLKTNFTIYISPVNN